MRLIDADELIPTTLTDGGYWTKEVFYKRDIDNAPTVTDVVPVVWCRDCKHFSQYTEAHKYKVQHADGVCGVMIFGVKDVQYSARKSNDYCSYGERKE